MIGLVLASLSVALPGCDVETLRRLPIVAVGQRCRAEGAFGRTPTDVTRCTRRRVRVAAPLDLALAVAAATRPASPGRTRVVVAGDSFAMSLVPGLYQVGEATATVDPVSAGIVGCGVGRGGRNRGVGLDREWPAPCQLRDPFLRVVVRLARPSVVVVAGGMWDVTDRQLPGDPAWRTVGDPVYDLYLIGEILHLVDLLRAEGVRVVWTTAPHWDPVFNPLLFMGPPPYPEAQPARTDRLNELFRQALAERPDVTLLDLAAQIQAMPGGEFGPGVRDDGAHLTASASATIATWLAPELVAVANRPS